MQRSLQNMILACAVLCFASHGLLAKSLLKQKTRPTMSQLVAHGEAVETELDGHKLVENNFNWDYWLETLEDYGPRFIAHLEKYYPDTTFAFMGRDSRVLGEMVEAFYLSLGQTDRVVYVSGSKATYEDSRGQPLHESNPHRLVGLLKSAGITITARNERPVLLIDTISRGQGRQGRALLHSIYKKWSSGRGRNAADIVDRIYMLGLIVSTYSGRSNSIKNRDRTLNRQKRAYKDGEKDYYNTIKPHTYKNPDGDDFCEAGYTHHTGEWHASFGRARKSSDGSYKARVGSLSHISMRRDVLAFQLEVLELAQSEEFRKAVIKEGKKLKLSASAFEKGDNCAESFTN